MRETTWRAVRRHSWPAWICLVAAVFTLDLSGCASLPLARSHRRDLDAERWWNVERVSTGSPIVVTLRDGTVVRGRYLGITHTSDAEYGARYSAWRDTTSMRPRPPAIGDQVRVERPRGKLEFGRFQGFDYRSVRITRGSSNRPVAWPFEDLVTLSELAGPPLTTQTLGEWLARGELPSASVLVVRLEQGEQSIPLERVSAMRVKGPNGWLTAAIAVGLLTIVIVILAQPRPQPQPQECGGTYPAWDISEPTPGTATSR